MGSATGVVLPSSPCDIIASGPESYLVAPHGDAMASFATESETRTTGVFGTFLRWEWRF